ncbi:MAG: hypothetical protein ACRC5T_08300, partial [Cetobacterium sp.]
NFGPGGALSPDVPAKPLNFRVEPAVNAFVAKVTNSDDLKIKGYNVYYRLVGEPDWEMTYTGNTVTLIGGLVGNAVYQAYMKTISIKNVESTEASPILTVKTTKLTFDSFEDELLGQLEQDIKDLADSLGGQIAKLEDIAEFLKDGYGNIMEDIDKKFHDVQTDIDGTKIQIGNLKTSVDEQLVSLKNATIEYTDSKIATMVSDFEVKFTEMGGTLDHLSTQINQTADMIQLVSEKLEARVDGLDSYLKEQIAEIKVTYGEILLKVETVTTDMNDLYGTITKEMTSITQTSAGIELMAKRVTSEFNKAEMMTSNFLFNSGKFVGTEDGTPMYWKKDPNV